MLPYTHEMLARFILENIYGWDREITEKLPLFDVDKIMVMDLKWIRVDTAETWRPRIITMAQAATMYRLKHEFGYCHQVFILESHSKGFEKIKAR